MFRIEKLIVFVKCPSRKKIPMKNSEGLTALSRIAEGPRVSRKTEKFPSVVGSVQAGRGSWPLMDRVPSW
jgi:hypothetical protein